MKRFASLPLAAVLAACSAVGGARGPTREAVTPALQNEAAALKRDGEKMDPALGVKATWNLKAVEVKDQPSDPDRPFTGTVRFVINSSVMEPTGPVDHNFERTFQYVYDAKLGKWLFKP